MRVSVAFVLALASSNLACSSGGNAGGGSASGCASSEGALTACVRDELQSFDRGTAFWRSGAFVVEFGMGEGTCEAPSLPFPGDVGGSFDVLVCNEPLQ